MINLTNKTKTSKFSRTKITSIAIALFLILSMTASMTLLPSANAHVPAWNIPTWSYVTSAPNPVGVGQNVMVVFWCDKTPPTAGGDGGDRWLNLQITVMKPDGTNESLGSFTSDPVGGAYTTFTPDQVGTYTVVFNFPQQTATLDTPTGVLGQ